MSRLFLPAANSRMVIEEEEPLLAIAFEANEFSLMRLFLSAVAVAAMTALAAASGMANHASGGRQSGAHQTTAAPHV